MPSSSDRIRALIAEGNRRLARTQPGARSGSRSSQSLTPNTVDDPELGRNEQYAAMVRDLRRQGALARRNQLSDWAFAFYGHLQSLLTTLKASKRSRALDADVTAVYTWYDANRGAEASSLQIGGLGLGLSSPSPPPSSTTHNLSLPSAASPSSSPATGTPLQLREPSSPALPARGVTTATTPAEGFGNLVPSPLHETIVRGSSTWAPTPEAQHAAPFTAAAGSPAAATTPAATTSSGAAAGHSSHSSHSSHPAESHVLGKPALTIPDSIVRPNMARSAIGDQRTAFDSSFTVEYAAQDEAEAVDHAASTSMVRRRHDTTPSARIKPAPLVDATYIEYDRRLHELIKATGGVSLGMASPRDSHHPLPPTVPEALAHASATARPSLTARRDRKSVAALRLRARPWSASASRDTAATVVASTQSEYQAAWEAPQAESAHDMLKHYKQRNLMSSYLQREAILNPKPPSPSPPQPSMRDDPGLLPATSLLVAQKLGSLPPGAYVAPSPHLLVTLEKQRQARTTATGTASNAAAPAPTATSALRHRPGTASRSIRSDASAATGQQRARPTTAPLRPSVFDPPADEEDGDEAWLRRKLLDAEQGKYLNDLAQRAKGAARARARAEEESMRRIESHTYASQTGGATHSLWKPADPALLDYDMAPLKERRRFGSRSPEASFESHPTNSPGSATSPARLDDDNDDSDDDKSTLFDDSSNSIESDKRATDAAAAKHVTIISNLEDLASSESSDDDELRGEGAAAWNAAQAAQAASDAQLPMVVATGPVVTRTPDRDPEARKHAVLKAIRDNRVLLSAYEHGAAARGAQGVAQDAPDILGGDSRPSTAHQRPETGSDRWRKSSTASSDASAVPPAWSAPPQFTLPRPATLSHDPPPPPVPPAIADYIQELREEREAKRAARLARRKAKAAARKGGPAAAAQLAAELAKANRKRQSSAGRNRKPKSRRARQPELEPAPSLERMRQHEEVYRIQQTFAIHDVHVEPAVLEAGLLVPQDRDYVHCVKYLPAPGSTARLLADPVKALADQRKRRSKMSRAQRRRAAKAAPLPRYPMSVAARAEAARTAALAAAEAEMAEAAALAAAPADLAAAGPAPPTKGRRRGSRKPSSVNTRRRKIRTSLSSPARPSSRPAGSVTDMDANVAAAAAATRAAAAAASPSRRRRKRGTKNSSPRKRRIRGVSRPTTASSSANENRHGAANRAAASPPPLINVTAE
ncbi:uncharacterized protein AMSG_04252 [Thecamonas trahens ATCC 50062]|uniref:Uncharacterized protein n=1 Tax=Thecamonas trahens ATCC 50062 TaxID=461836 RepID=A0A0L0D9P3_THETB|nr:hypothetical protein AMSG_04252 [Thecamonas trahens ATCC 50062]KNC48018.1 hypothetical protein AMSG_04252 [Thecamonas trahens ATCC 50062]|eukprot:XP_013759033.1 hypothetical protein AMSG_04252 [Thecamonas trahens ATCC 50062]